MPSEYFNDRDAIKSAMKNVLERVDELEKMDKKQMRSAVEKQLSKSEGKRVKIDKKLVKEFLVELVKERFEQELKAGTVDATSLDNLPATTMAANDNNANNDDVDDDGVNVRKTGKRKRKDKDDGGGDDHNTTNLDDTTAAAEPSRPKKKKIKLSKKKKSKKQKSDDEHGSSEDSSFGGDDNGNTTSSSSGGHGAETSSDDGDFVSKQPRTSRQRKAKRKAAAAAAAADDADTDATTTATTAATSDVTAAAAAVDDEDDAAAAADNEGRGNADGGQDDGEEDTTTSDSSDSDSDAGPAKPKARRSRKSKSRALQRGAGGDEDGDAGAGYKVSKVDLALLRMKKQKKELDHGQLVADMRAFVDEMERADEEDRRAYERKQPGTHKLAMLKKVENTLRQSHLHEILIGKHILSVIKQWLDPMSDGTLPSLAVRTTLLDALLNSLPERMNLDDLKESKIGHVVMFLSQHPFETTANRRTCSQLIARWSAPIYQRPDGLDDVLKQVTVVKEDRRTQARAAVAGSRERRRSRGNDSEDDDDDDDDAIERDIDEDDDGEYVVGGGGDAANAGERRQQDAIVAAARAYKSKSRQAGEAGVSGSPTTTISSSEILKPTSLSVGKSEILPDGDLAKMMNDTTVQTSVITGKVRRPRVRVPQSAPRTFTIMPGSVVKPKEKRGRGSAGGADEAEEVQERVKKGSGSGRKKPTSIEQKLDAMKRKKAARGKKTQGVSVNKIVL